MTDEYGHYGRRIDEKQTRQHSGKRQRCKEHVSTIYIPCTYTYIDIYVYVSTRQLCGNSMKWGRPKCAVGISAAFVTALQQQQQPTTRDRTLPMVVTTRPAVSGYNGGTRRSGAVNQDHHHNDDDDDRTSMLPNVTTSIKMITTNNNKNNNNNNKNRIDDTEFDWDTFLDTPFFDPHRILQDPNSDERWKRFATWVQEDYETVEVIFTATLFIVLIVVTQELLRIQIYGLEHYVPFGQGTRPGSLF